MSTQQPQYGGQPYGQQPQFQQPMSPAAAAPAPKKPTWYASRPFVGAACLLLGTGMGAGAVGGSASSSSTATETTTVTTTTTESAAAGAEVTVTQTAEAQPAPTVTVTETAEAPTTEPEPSESTQPDASGLGDGMYQVGVDIKPGKYTATVPADSYGCYYARLSSESTSDIIDNNLAESGKVFVTIKKSDKYFETKRCGEWRPMK